MAKYYNTSSLLLIFFNSIFLVHFVNPFPSIQELVKDAIFHSSNIYISNRNVYFINCTFINTFLNAEGNVGQELLFHNGKWKNTIEDYSKKHRPQILIINYNNIRFTNIVYKASIMQLKKIKTLSISQCLFSRIMGIIMNIEYAEHMSFKNSIVSYIKTPDVTSGGIPSAVINIQHSNTTSIEKVQFHKILGSAIKGKQLSILKVKNSIFKDFKSTESTLTVLYNINDEQLAVILLETKFIECTLNGAVKIIPTQRQHESAISIKKTHSRILVYIHIQASRFANCTTAHSGASIVFHAFKHLNKGNYMLNIYMKVYL